VHCAVVYGLLYFVSTVSQFVNISDLLSVLRDSYRYLPFEVLFFGFVNISGQLGVLQSAFLRLWGQRITQAQQIGTSSLFFIKNQEQ
jgi:hypothetical protein